MDSLQFVNLLGLVIGLVAALFFCVGSMLIRPRQMEEFASTYWNRNPHFLAYLQATKVEYVCGGLALIGSFALQFLGSVRGILPDCQLFTDPIYGAAAAIIIGATFGGLLLLLRRWHVRQIRSPEGATPGSN